MEETRDLLAIMAKRESKYYACYNYVADESSSCCVCKESQRALHLLYECARVVTDVSSHPVFDSEPPSSTKSNVTKSPSAVSVRDLEDPHQLSSVASQSAPGSVDSFCKVCHKPTQPQTSPFSSANPSDGSVQYWREQMFDWCCLVVDSYGIQDRSGVVALSFSLLDRFLTHELKSLQEDAFHEPITRDDFQLYSMTALYIAVKLMEGRRLTIEALVHMSRFFYKPADIAATEQEMLTALQWHLNAPTPIEYCRLMWQLFPSQQSSRSPQWSELEGLCVTLTEVASSDASFVSSSASTIAVACIVLASRIRKIPETEINDFIKNLDGLLEKEGYQSEFQRVYYHLERSYCH